MTNSPAPKSFRHICVVRLSALGDVCLTVPVIRTLQFHFPAAEITWVIGRPALPLVELLPNVRFVVLEKAKGWKGLRALLHTRRQLSQLRFDALLALQASLRAHLLYPAIQAPLKIGFDRTRARDGHQFFIHQSIPFAPEHLLDGFLRFPAALGATPPRIEWNLPLSDSDRLFAQSKLAPHRSDQPWLAINPAASKAERNWLPDRYARVAQEAATRWNCRILLTGGPSPADRSLADAILQSLPPHVPALNLVGQTSPRQLCAVLALCRALLAPDTGPAHFATAVGTPVVGLFAVITSKLSAPYLSPHLAVDKYPEAVRLFLHRDPSHIPWGTRVHDPRAMSLISCDDVLQQLSKIFSEPPPHIAPTVKAHA